MKTESKLDKFLSEISYLHHPDVLYKGLKQNRDRYLGSTNE